ncbi:MAG: hypothetical protein AAFQ98_01560 [Bacteroidota bacterium]
MGDNNEQKGNRPERELAEFELTPNPQKRDETFIIAHTIVNRYMELLSFFGWRKAEKHRRRFEQDPHTYLTKVPHLDRINRYGIISVPFDIDKITHHARVGRDRDEAHGQFRFFSFDIEELEGRGIILQPIFATDGCTVIGQTLKDRNQVDDIVPLPYALFAGVGMTIPSEADILLDTRLAYPIVFVKEYASRCKYLEVPGRCPEGDDAPQPRRSAASTIPRSNVIRIPQKTDKDNFYYIEEDSLRIGATGYLQVPPEGQEISYPGGSGIITGQSRPGITPPFDDYEEDQDYEVNNEEPQNTGEMEDNESSSKSLLAQNHQRIKINRNNRGGRRNNRSLRVDLKLKQDRQNQYIIIRMPYLIVDYDIVGHVFFQDDPNNQPSFILTTS